jgi:hypothetical protein
MSPHHSDAVKVVASIACATDPRFFLIVSCMAFAAFVDRRDKHIRTLVGFLNFIMAFITL